MRQITDIVSVKIFGVCSEAEPHLVPQASLKLGILQPQLLLY